MTTAEEENSQTPPDAKGEIGDRKHIRSEVPSHGAAGFGGLDGLLSRSS